MSSEPLLLAIDAGTGSCRAGLFDISGRQVAMGQREYSHPEAPGVPGSQVFETARNWELICACVREALSEAGGGAERVAAVSTTSMREGMVLYDAAGREIWACPNVDSRAGEEAAELVASGKAEEIYRHAGDWVAITSPARFLWIAKHEPEVFAAVAHVGMLGDWIVTRLSGEFATDPSLGSSSGLFEIAGRDWSDDVLELIGLDRSVFPPVVEPGTVVGAVAPRAALETGLREGTPVVAGGADTQLGLLGIGVAEQGCFTVVGGSFWQATVLLDEPLIDPEARLRTLCHTEPGQWMMEGIGFYCGLVMRWFRDAFCELEQAEAGQTGEDVYSILERKAATVPPGANGIFGLFSNVMQASRWVHGAPAFIGFDVGSPERSGRAACFRAIEEAAAYVAFGHLGIVQEVAGIEVGEAVLTGGAAKGTLWPEIVADMLGIPVRVPFVKESTALGAAICAGVGAGLYDDATSTARELARFERTVEPDITAHAAYLELYDRWLELYRRALELSEAGLVRPLWRAAGTTINPARKEPGETCARS
jgi:autoinducer 2 (AI-2) kinase